MAPDLYIDPFTACILVSLMILLAGAEIMLLWRGRRILQHATWTGFVIRCGLWFILLANTLIGLFDKQFLSDATEVMIESVIVGFFLYALYDRWREELRAEKQRAKLREREQQLEDMRANSEKLAKWDGPTMSILF